MISSLCGLGKSAPNPLLSTLRYFADEYRAHIEQQHCPAGVCKALTHFRIDPDTCTACGACYRVCPAGAIERNGNYRILPEKCVACGECRAVCKFDAVTW
jgi:ferredoxin